jgi:hypothetical protein
MNRVIRVDSAQRETVVRPLEMRQCRMGLLADGARSERAFEMGTRLQGLPTRGPRIGLKPMGNRSGREAEDLIQLSNVWPARSELLRRCRSDTHEVAPNTLKNRYKMQNSLCTRTGLLNP